MQKFVSVGYLIFFLLFFSLQSSLKGQTALIEVKALNQYEFEVSNVSGFPIEVHIDTAISFRLLPERWKVLDTKGIGKASVMHLKYTKSDAVMEKR